ncbi:MAG: autotransporter outer membrane beta-barrel domain-containing protein [Hyphomicrobiaceae bacterium]
MARYSWHEIAARRTVDIGLITNATFGDSMKAAYESRTMQAFGELGWRLGTSSFGFEPFANVAHVALETDGFKEDGGAAALTVEATKTSTSFTTLGVRLSSVFGLGSVQTTARGTVGWRHAFGDTSPLSTHRFATGDAFTVAGAPIAQDAAVFDAGLDFQVSPTGTLGLFYSGQYAAGASENGLNARLNLKF